MFTSRPKYLFTLFFALQGLVFGLCWLFQVSGAPDDLWLIALVHIPVCMCIGAIEQVAASKGDMTHISCCDDDTYFNLLDEQPH